MSLEYPSYNKQVLLQCQKDVEDNPLSHPIRPVQITSYHHVVEGNTHHTHFVLDNIDVIPFVRRPTSSFVVI